MQQRSIADGVMLNTRLRTIRLALIAVVLACVLLNAQSINAQVNVTTYHNDNNLNGNNRNETTLTQANVNATNFGTLFTIPVDGYVYAQPLYMSNVDNIPGLGTRNLVFVATQHDSVYAFDADNGALIWHRNFTNPGDDITSVPQPDVISRDIVPEVGITGTPVIDASAGTIYFVTKTREVQGRKVPHFVQRLHALNIRTGGERAGSPVLIGDTIRGGPDGGFTNNTPISVPGTGFGSSGGVLRFNALRALQRPALTLSSGVVYVGWASHGDNGPYHGWVVGFDKTTLQIVKIFNTSPNSGLSGIWQSGGGLAADAQGNLYFATGNGPFVPPGPRALGGGGGDLGYRFIGKSVAVFFRTFPTRTGLGTNGGFGDQFEMPGFDFNASAQPGFLRPHTFSVTLTYDGTTLTETITNTNTGSSFSKPYAVNIPATVGGNTAFVGFTGATGGLNARHDILTWTFGNAINHSDGFASHSDLTANGDASFPSGTTVARITAAQNGQRGSIFSNAKVDIRNFTTTFTFQIGAGSDPIADGLTFTIQGLDSPTELGDSVVKLSTSGPLTLADYFTPFNERTLEIQDADLGSGGTMVFPDQPGPAPRLMVETGKQGRIYLISRDNLGGYRRGIGCNQTPIPVTCDAVVQVLDQGITGVWGNPSYFVTNTNNNSGIMYYHGSGDVLKGFQMTNGVLNATPARGGQAFPFPGGQPVISSNGTNNGIVWDLQVNAFGTSGPAILHAYNAIPSGSPAVLNEVYNSSQTGQRDQLGGAVKFTVPTVANGKIYVGTQTTLEVLGLFPPAMAAPVAASDLTATTLSDTQIRLSWTNNAVAPNNATGIKILRSTDGETFTLVTTVRRNATTFTDTGLMPSTDYFYIVRATNQVGDSPDSNVATARTRIAASVLQVVDVCNGQINISWTGVADDHYTIERSTDGTIFDVIATVDASVTSLTDNDVDIGSFFYRVRAFNADGDSSVSNTAKATVGPITIDHSTGFASHDDLIANGSTQFTVENLARLNNDFGQAGSFFTVQRVGIRGFETTFTFRLHEGTQPDIADGFTFTLQGNSPTALGGGGGALGYAGIRNSIAIKFDVFNNEGEGTNSTGLFLDGHFPGIARPGSGDVLVRLDPNVINLRSQNIKRVTLTYNGTTLTETITEFLPDMTTRTFTTTYTIDIAAAIGGDTAFAGFTGGTGGLFSLQDILTWSYNEQGKGNLAPRSPSNLRITDVQPSGPSTFNITISWKCNNAFNAEGFRIERSTNGTTFMEIATFDTSVTTYTDENLSAGSYFYRVLSFNATGNSRPSNTVCIPVGSPANVIDKSGGFACNGDLTANGTASYTGSLARLTSGGNGQAGSIFSNNQVDVTSFETTFTFHIHQPGSNPFADGMAFVIQSNSPTALFGPPAGGGGLGYGSDQPGGPLGIRNSVAIKFDIFNNAGEGINSTGIFTDGRSPTVRQSGLPDSIPDQSIDLGDPSNPATVINLHSQHPMRVNMTYDGAVLNVTITDTVTLRSAMQSYTVDIPSFVGGDTAFVGFTGATGGLNATQDVQTWTFRSTSK